MSVVELRSTETVELVWRCGATCPGVVLYRGDIFGVPLGTALAELIVTAERIHDCQGTEDG